LPFHRFSRQPSNGLAVLFSLQTCKLEVTKMAQVALAKREKEAIAPTITPDEALSEWLSEHRSENTRAAYYRDLVDFCKTVFNAEPKTALRRFFSLDEITARRKVIQFKQLLRERGLSPTSINRKLSALRVFIGYAKKLGIIGWNIKELIEGEKQRTDAKERVKMRLPAASVEGLLDALNRLFAVIPRKGARGLRDRAIVALMALHGLRRVEIVRLSLSDLWETDGVLRVRVWGKGDKFRVIPLRKDTTELIRRYLASLRRSGIEPIPDAFGVPLFVSFHKGKGQKGQRLHWRQVNKIVDKALQRAGLKRLGISCHSLRHTFATLAAMEVPLPELADYLGHSSIATTGVYAHALQTVNPSTVIKVKVL
jgi:site-specific recombinase XerD